MALKFYEGAEKRDQSLLNNTLNASQSRGTSVLITGGFHTRGLVELMKKQGIGYAVIQPKFSSSEQLDLYHKVMRDEHADLSAYMDKPYLTKQEALALKEILEVGIPVLFETYKIPYGGIASIVAAAVNRNRGLKDRIVTEEVEAQNGSRLEFKIRERSTDTQGKGQGVGTETSGVGDTAFLKDWKDI